MNEMTRTVICAFALLAIHANALAFWVIGISLAIIGLVIVAGRIKDNDPPNPDAQAGACPYKLEPEVELRDMEAA